MNNGRFWQKKVDNCQKWPTKSSLIRAQNGSFYDWKWLFDFQNANFDLVLVLKGIASFKIVISLFLMKIYCLSKLAFFLFVTWLMNKMSQMSEKDRA